MIYLMIVIIGAIIGTISYIMYNKITTSRSKNDLSEPIIKKSTGNKSLVLLDYGKNRETVLATLRQITGLDSETANKISQNLPATIYSNISDEEADLNKKALEFVGANVEIK